MLVELGVVEQRYAAVREVLRGATVVDVARRNGVARQTVHDWLRKYATGGMAALVDRSSKPAGCAHQMRRRSRRAWSIPAARRDTCTAPISVRSPPLAGPERPFSKFRHMPSHEVTASGVRGAKDP